jgi:hypothetical protein
MMQTGDAASGSGLTGPRRLSRGSREEWPFLGLLSWVKSPQQRSTQNMASPKDEPVTIKLSLTLDPGAYKILKDMAGYYGYPGEKALLLDIMKDGLHESEQTYWDDREKAHEQRKWRKHAWQKRG